MKQDIEYHVREYVKLRDRNIAREERDALDYREIYTKCENLERKLADYKGYEVERANLLGKLHE